MRQRFAARALWQICWICSLKAFVRWCCLLLLPNNPKKISFCYFYFISIRCFRLVFFAPCFCHIYAKDTETPSTTPTIRVGICATCRYNTFFSFLSSTTIFATFLPYLWYTEEAIVSIHITPYSQHLVCSVFAINWKIIRYFAGDNIIVYLIVKRTPQFPSFAF